MSEQPTAPRLADALEATDYYEDLHEEAAAELRRLSTVNAELRDALKQMLEVWEEDPAYGATHADKARAAIAKAEGSV
jgi:hypothetical protein